MTLALYCHTFGSGAVTTCFNNLRFVTAGIRTPKLAGRTLSLSVPTMRLQKQPFTLMQTGPKNTQYHYMAEILPIRRKTLLNHPIHKRKVGCSNPSRDRPKSLEQVVAAPLPNAPHRCECHRSSSMTIINGCLVSQLVWHDK